MIKTREKTRSIAAAVTLALILSLAGVLVAAELQAIKLNPPDLKRGLPFMQALAVRASVREFAEKDLSLQDLSDLLWAADGMSRPAENKSTAPSAMNAHDIRIYVFTKEGAYLYDSPKHELLPVLAGDFRSQLMMARPPRPATSPAPATSAPAGVTPTAPQAAAAPVPPPPPPPTPSIPPVQIVLVSDGDRFTRGYPERKFEWGALDAGIVSQNISLFCAATGLKTVPRALIDKARIKELLKLADTQNVFLNHPVGYAK
ncbi:MAG: SagB/ThcOx family dehydrogenase [Candidatus Aminicenantes bacterium]|nr:SagB/ThcOx family dehydrogenase [Candidatus Aminicenantes bacterium]